MSVDQIANEVLQLTSHDRAVIAETIWASLEDPFKFSTDMSDEEAIKLAKQRDSELTKGMVTPLSHKDLMDRLRK